MIGLILKDILNLKRHSKIYLVLLVFYFVIGIANENSAMFSSMIAVVAAMMPITAMAYDERSKWDRYALTMPISRFNIIVSKYILGLIFLAMAFVITMLFSLLYAKLNLMENILINVGTLSVGILIISVVFPLLFKFGVEKGRILMMMVLFAPTGIILIMSKLGIDIPTVNEEIIKLIVYLSPLFALALFTLSILISLFIYNKKEF